MNLLLMLAHSVAEYDDVRMFSDLGYNVFSIGAYTRPATPGDDTRPPLPDAPYFPDLADMVEGDQMAHKEHLPDGLIDWADVIIAHHYIEKWLLGQWDRISHKRVIWRTCGQSDPRHEAALKPYHDSGGLQIVRYSPKERPAFEKMGAFAGEDAMIRFGKYPSDYGPWTGEDPWVVNVTQGLLQRGEFTHPDFWLGATEGLPRCAIGEGSEALKGIGKVPYEAMVDMLRKARAYLYTGTQPASYTLGLLEAMMSGVPILSIGKQFMWMPELFEGHELAVTSSESAIEAFDTLGRWLNDWDSAAVASMAQREKAKEFDVAFVGARWVEFLGQP